MLWEMAEGAPRRTGKRKPVWRGTVTTERWTNIGILFFNFYIYLLLISCWDMVFQILSSLKRSQAFGIFHGKSLLQKLALIQFLLNSLEGRRRNCRFSVFTSWVPICKRCYNQFCIVQHRLSPMFDYYKHCVSEHIWTESLLTICDQFHRINTKMWENTLMCMCFGKVLHVRCKRDPLKSVTLAQQPTQVSVSWFLPFYISILNYIRIVAIYWHNL